MCFVTDYRGHYQLGLLSYTSSFRPNIGVPRIILSDSRIIITLILKRYYRFIASFKIGRIHVSLPQLARKWIDIKGAE